MTEICTSGCRRPARRAVSAAFCLLVLLGFAAPGAAQLQPGAANVATALGTRGVDAAHHPGLNVYLVVSAFGPVTGVFVNSAGAAVTAPFLISSSGHSNFPRARYSADLNNGAGGFLVAWTSETGLSVRTRVVAYPGTLLGAENQISDASSTAWLEAAPAIAYSPTSRVFLVAWQGQGNIGVVARTVSLAGTGISVPIRLASGFARDPGVAWNPGRDQFGVSFSGEGASGGYSVFAIVPPGNPGGFTRTTFNQLGGGARTYITDVDFSTLSNRFVMTWYEEIKARVAEFDEAGSLLADGVASFRVGSYDALSLAFNPRSQTFLLVGVNPFADTVTGVELNGRGFPVSLDTLLAPATARYTRVAASTTAPQWLAQYSGNFRSANTAAVQTSTVGGGPAGGFTGSSGSAPPAPTPSPTPSAPAGCPGFVPDMTCVNGNWVPNPPSGTPSAGGGSGCPGFVPGMTCVNGNWVPNAPTGTPSAGGGTGCPGFVPGMTCVNGNWVPNAPTGTPSAGGGTGCPGFVPGMTCVNGNWVPNEVVGTPSAGGGSSCPGFVPGMTCVNGNWVPNGVSGTPSPSGGTSCPGFVPGMTCVNGNWVPNEIVGTPSAGGGTSCPGFVPGMTCVNGNWVPNGVSGTPSSSGGTSCPGFVPGMTCINGNWIPNEIAGTPSVSGGTGCPGFVPGMTCINGEWTPGIVTAALTSLPVCSGGSAAPAADWVRIGAFEWVPLSHPSSARATCRAQ